MSYVSRWIKRSGVWLALLSMVFFPPLSYAEDLIEDVKAALECRVLDYGHRHYNLIIFELIQCVGVRDQCHNR